MSWEAEPPADMLALLAAFREHAEGRDDD
jgi:hypothetical protein